jgi:hypothetical protein
MSSVGGHFFCAPPNCDKPAGGLEEVELDDEGVLLVGVLLSLLQAVSDTARIEATIKVLIIRVSLNDACQDFDRLAWTASKECAPPHAPAARYN